jgi:hypothetical protein
VIDLSALQFLLMGVTGWLERREREAIAYLVTEDWFFHQLLGGRRLRFTGADRRLKGARIRSADFDQGRFRREAYRPRCG